MRYFLDSNAVRSTLRTPTREIVRFTWHVRDREEKIPGMSRMWKSVANSQHEIIARQICDMLNDIHYGREFGPAHMQAAGELAHIRAELELIRNAAQGRTLGVTLPEYVAHLEDSLARVRKSRDERTAEAHRDREARNEQAAIIRRGHSENDELKERVAELSRQLKASNERHPIFGKLVVIGERNRLAEELDKCRAERDAALDDRRVFLERLNMFEARIAELSKL